MVSESSVQRGRYCIRLERDKYIERTGVAVHQNIRLLSLPQLLHLLQSQRVESSTPTGQTEEIIIKTQLGEKDISPYRSALLAD